MSSLWIFRFHNFSMTLISGLRSPGAEMSKVSLLSNAANGLDRRIGEPTAGALLSNASLTPLECRVELRVRVALAAMTHVVISQSPTLLHLLDSDVVPLTMASSQRSIITFLRIGDRKTSNLIYPSSSSSLLLLLLLSCFSWLFPGNLGKEKNACELREHLPLKNKFRFSGVRIGEEVEWLGDRGEKQEKTGGLLSRCRWSKSHDDDDDVSLRGGWTSNSSSSNNPRRNSIQMLKLHVSTSKVIVFRLHSSI